MTGFRIQCDLLKFQADKAVSATKIYCSAPSLLRTGSHCMPQTLRTSAGCSTSSTAPDNDGTVLIRSGASRYIRQYDGLIDPRWFGLVYDATTDQMAALDKALFVGPTQIDGNVYIETTAVKLGDKIRVRIVDADEYDLWAEPV